jgi:hypothetical protein
MPEVETIKRTRKDKRQSEKGRKNPKRAPLPLWSRMIFGILKGEAFKFFSTDAISRQSRAAVKRRSPTRRSAGARKAVRTKAPAKKTVRKKGG